MPDRSGDTGGTAGDGDRDGQDDPRDDPTAPAPAARSGPPDPRDRLWRHPSELAGSPPLPPPAAERRARPAARAGTARFWGGAVLSGIVGSLATVTLLALTGVLDTDDGTAAAPASASAATAATRTGSDATRLASRAASSLVAVRTAGESGTRTGTGVCVRQGTVLTSDVLVGEAEQVLVVASDGTESRAVIRGRDPVTDLVLLELDTAVTVANVAAETPTPGDDVYAVGAPTRGQEAPWVSHGVVASLDAMATRSTGTSLTGLIETDAAAAEGAAGGALLDRAGHVVGIVVWPASGRAGALAVPIDVALKVAHELDRKGWVERAWIGVAGVDAGEGIEVTKVTEDGPAGRAGVHVGDVVVRVGGRDVATMGDLLRVVRDHEPGQRTTITVRRAGEILELGATLGMKRSTGTAAAWAGPAAAAAP